ncbi:hypothetical protein PV10_00714 [Exophiala mesophila]|uniref:CST complex subunit Ten1 n=1 Tax=Exophiala mesophila TaxID=212818 RepID=A0A0D1X522_EXOME|nr:uncharacterized protein PV10_00714 [Exophiala mesophila]KIV96900.1 hypothetical protein PV10_00714 [Exophiala mesophila]
MSGGNTSAPVASTFAWLADLPSLPSRSKVRCLGHIVEYDLKGSCALLEHTYPTSADITRIWLDVNLVLESTDRLVLQPGNWINVIGYVQNPAPAHLQKSSLAVKSTVSTTSLQAILVWDAGSIHLEEYERTMEEHKRVQREVKTVRRAQCS